MTTAVTTDGARIALDVREPEGPARGVVLAGHAMMCNHLTLDRPRGGGLASALAAAGLRVAQLDVRGHGDSTGGPASYDDVVLRDLPAVAAYAADAWPDLPLIALGHSLTAHGWLVSLALRPHPRIRAVVSLGGGAMLPAGRPLAVWWAARGLTEVGLLWSRLAGRIPARRLGWGTEDVHLPLWSQWATSTRARTWGGSEGDYREALARVSLPVLSVTSLGDRFLCPPAASRGWHANATSADVTERVVGDRPGDPVDVDHMGLVIDPRMAPVWREIAAWILEFTGHTAGSC
ncbi:MAG: alpha/beta hydrolase [Alphaproteobacteria bacterium]|nr:alpha/beta hydrolase [Alphaproteobacteria bacterium]